MRVSRGLLIKKSLAAALILLIACLTAAGLVASAGAQSVPKQDASNPETSTSGGGTVVAAHRGTGGGGVAVSEGVAETGMSKDAIVQRGTAKAVASREGVKMMLKKIHWLGHDCFRIDGDNVIYFDPLELKRGAVPADIILITHEHSDHCSPKDVAKIQKKGTVIVTTPDCAKKLSGEIKAVKPGDTITVKGVTIEAVPAYNIDKRFHTKDKGWVGYIITVGGTRIYHAGDTDFIPEMKTFKVDIALLPVSGTYVMTAEEAVKAAETLKPQIAIPMHYGGIIGTDKDAAAFKQKSSVPVEILRSEK